MADGKSARRFVQMETRLMEMSVDEIERMVITASLDIGVNAEKLAIASFDEGVRCAGAKYGSCKYSRKAAETRIWTARMEVASGIRELARRARGCE